jgi:metal transporter CNNM
VDIFIWLGIAFCLSQSAVFSGLNIAYFSLSRLQLEVEAKRGNTSAQKILLLREDSNFLLATILWGNVSINVILTLLSDSVLFGVYSFLFSTIAITFLGEIIPQAYFSRNALRIGARLTIIIRFYQILLFPVTKLTALILDGWLGKEGITYFRERELKALLMAHVEADEAEVQHVEGIGALNFLMVDEISVAQEGESLDPQSIIGCECRLDLPLIPNKGEEGYDDFIRRVHRSGHKWVVLTNHEEVPHLILDADGFLRAALLDTDAVDAYAYCHRPLIIDDPDTTLGHAMMLLKRAHFVESDEVLDQDVVLIWCAAERRVITGADILGRLLKGIGQGDLYFQKKRNNDMPSSAFEDGV